jgi:molybdate transport system ATP-binding protein
MRIVLDHLRLHRGGRVILDGVSWDVAAGERWLVIGASGAGKTQLLKIVAGDVWPDDATPPPRRYFFKGEWHEEPVAVRDELAWLGPERQDRYERYGWNYPVIDVVGTGLHRTDLPLNRLAPAERASCLALLRRAGIARLAARRFLTLSYGERRLVLLARTLAWRAAVLLLDEVATGLDAGNRERLYRMLGGRELKHSTWICSAHRHEDIPPGATKLLWLHAGVVRYAGPMRATHLREALAAAGAAPPRRLVAKRGNTKPRLRHAARPMLALASASVYVDGRRLLRDLDFTVRRGECWVLHGGNGAGKSTLLRTLYGDHSVASGGTLKRAGQGPGIPLNDFRARTGLIAPHLQTDYPRHYSVEEVVVSGLHSSIGLNFRSTSAERRRALVALRSLGMEAFAARPLAELSYGQVRRVLFARAVVARPRLLLMDEPFTGLNAPLRAELLAWLEARVAAGITVVMATHYRSEWPRNASHELHLSRGRVVYAGKLRR